VKHDGSPRSCLSAADSSIIIIIIIIARAGTGQLPINTRASGMPLFWRAATTKSRLHLFRLRSTQKTMVAHAA